LALISATASLTPSRIDTPIGAEPPVNGPATPILIGSAAIAPAEKPRAIPATSIFNLKVICHLLFTPFFIVSSTLEIRPLPYPIDGAL
jgi:hypothetical protein